MSMYAYPAHTPGAESTSGFYFNLTSTQREQLRQTRVWMEDEQGLQPHRLCPHVLATDLTLLRYLRANKFDVDSATQVKNLKYFIFV